MVSLAHDRPAGLGLCAQSHHLPPPTSTGLVGAAKGGLAVQPALGRNLFELAA